MKAFNTKEYIKETITDLKNKVGSKKILSAVSGGVDSSTATALASKAGLDITAIYVDTGLMRDGETEEVKKLLSAFKGVNLIIVDAKARFLKRLKGVSDPERKRKIIGHEFIKVFKETVKALPPHEFLMQGTLCSSDKVLKEPPKSYHNATGLPKILPFKCGLLEPLRGLYKAQVCEIGKTLGLPNKMFERQPFPGPALAVRIDGNITEEKLAIVRKADKIFVEIIEEEIRKGGLSRENFSQYFATLSNTRWVGLKNGKRNYERVIILKAVKTDSFVDSAVSELPWEILRKVNYRIMNEVDGVGAVAYNISHKSASNHEEVSSTTEMQ